MEKQKFNLIWEEQKQQDILSIAYSGLSKSKYTYSFILKIQKKFKKISFKYTELIKRRTSSNLDNEWC